MINLASGRYTLWRSLALFMPMCFKRIRKNELPLNVTQLWQETI